MEEWLEVSVGKEGSLEEKNLERSSKAGEGGRWDMSVQSIKHKGSFIFAHCSGVWTFYFPHLVFYLKVAGSGGG